MSRHLPNLKQLRAFEATARHLSFKDAATELFVTQAAVSHQIKALEQDIGRQLFLRHGRTVSLTQDAQIFVADITFALDRIAKATATLKSKGLAGTLKISLAGFFGDRVIRPHLAEFKALYPDVQLEFSYSRKIVDFDATEFNAAIIYGEGNRKGLHSIPICNERTAVCTPGLVAGLDMPVSVETVARLPLATTKNHATGWLDWFAAAGFEDTSNLNFIEFDDGGLALGFAETGEGVALVADIPLIQHELSTGFLVVINPLTITLDYGIYLFCPETPNIDARILAFAAWLKTVVARIQAG